MGSLEAIARAKGELLEQLRPDGCAVLNADDPNVVAQAPRFAGRRVWFGTAAHAEYRAERRSAQRFRLVTPRGACEVQLALPGPHLVMNGLCAAAAADQTGLLGREPLAAIRAALEAFRGLPGRLSLRDGQDGVRVLDDSYNANPTSVRAALVTLRELAGERRALVLLGDMRELGPEEEHLHAETGRAIAESGAYALIGVGPRSAHAVSAAKQAGIAIAQTASDPAAAGHAARAIAGPGDVVLVKGSRSSQMEGAVAVLVGGAAPREGVH
jgi:UDP-N-acetylmuramoyl-tripeptide--D-alanyl-D-alanine ligase